MRNTFTQSTDEKHKIIAEARLLEEIREYHACEDILMDGVEKYPNSAELLYELAKRTRFRRVEDPRTLEYLERAFNLMPWNDKISADYAAFLHKQGESENAEMVYLFSYNSENPSAKENKYILTGLAHVYEETGRFEMAALCFGRAAYIFPDDGFTRKRHANFADTHPDYYSHERWDDFLTYAGSVLATKLDTLPVERMQQFDHKFTHS